jgi:hypothetical protein
MGNTDAAHRMRGMAGLGRVTGNMPAVKNLGRKGRFIQNLGRKSQI